MAEESQNAWDGKIKINRTAVLVYVILLIIFDLGLFACSIAEMVIGDLTARGLGFGMALFNICVWGFAFATYASSTFSNVRNLYWSCVFGMFFAVCFTIGQMVRIIFVLDFRSIGRDVVVEDITAAGAIWWTELGLIYGASLCIAILAAVSRQSMEIATKVADAEPQNAQRPMEVMDADDQVAVA